MGSKIEGTDEAWESGALGANEEHVVVAGGEHEIALDEAMGLMNNRRPIRTPAVSAPSTSE